MGTTAAGVFGILTGALFFVVLWYALTLAARWMVFSKAGIAGWKAFIPIYSTYCLYRIAWRRNYFWWYLAALVISSYVNSDIERLTEAGQAVPALFGLLSTVLGLIVLVLNVLVNIHLAARYGHSFLFGLGLMILPPLFTVILGMGASEYRGNPAEGLPPRRYYV